MTQNSQLDVVFDGQCGVCTRAAYWLLRHDRRGRIRVHPAQRSGVLEEFNISAVDAEQAAWAFEDETRRSELSGSDGHDDSDGGDSRVERVKYRGAAAINRALDVAFNTSVFLPFYRVPGIRHVQDAVYEWVANHRYRFRGVTPWCQQYPDDCAGTTGEASCSR